MKGTYLLILQLEYELPDLNIGKLGHYRFDPGYYLYVGSALGSGGLEARLRHHLRRDKPRYHWHIDYLRPHTSLIETWSVATPLRLECLWCATLRATPGLSSPIPRFGASDRGCLGHLFYSPRRPAPPLLVRSLFSALPASDIRELTLDISRYDDVV